ncbi:hypothetical protein [Lentilactobacillus kefiri]|uniref:Uncharacterized protein n=1 Tax=Lentilactobacillus kefiri TaxID=33962 RepID=A0A511DWP9_LENKE|nr:hypothetical protein [Lentilactobacillus kefiri]MCJ2162668.1 hypothetical protein [Lentilactobacillus kefiri]MCP9370012.1 hypothetical protein [Lentilactobacillus kefiri]MDH5109352.1 hypothetical protein [Lentilactobacillus kefiri]PAK58639.1 hypothetical protein B9K02_10485 [Lentilactobacillus kefiri]PAK81181.1 hypothetical protein B8W85_10465 [Lentilactobacillus kefiri]
MKKQLILLTGLIAGFTGLTLATSPQSVKAAGVYHTVKSKTANNTAFHWNGSTKAYLWNYNLTQKKHHLTNYPKTTWYASRVLKMTNGTKTGIFYYVSNKSGSVKGYAWKGYLTRGAYSSNSAANNNNTDKSTTTNWVTTDNPGGIPHPTKKELSALKSSYSDPYEEDAYDLGVTYYQDLPIIKDFMGTIYNSKLNSTKPDGSSNTKYIKVSVKPTDQQIQDLANGSLTFKQFVLADLNKQHIDLSAYKSWQINMSSTPIYQKANKQYAYPKFGDYTITLLAPQHQ